MMTGSDRGSEALSPEAQRRQINQDWLQRQRQRSATSLTDNSYRESVARGSVASPTLTDADWINVSSQDGLLTNDDELPDFSDLNLSKEFFLEKDKGIQQLIEKWTHINQSILFGKLNARGDLEKIAESAKNDLMALNDQQVVISQWLVDNNADSPTRQSMLILFENTKKAIETPQAVQKHCTGTLMVLNRNTLLSVGLSSESSASDTGAPVVYHNPFVSWQRNPIYQSFAHNNHPSAETPLKASYLADVRGWSPLAAISYDPTAGEYSSVQLVKNNTLLWQIASATFTSREKKTGYRNAIEKIVQDMGSDRGQRFQSKMSISVRKTFGIPLTPKLIEEVELMLNQEDGVVESRESNASSSQDNPQHGFFENLTMTWRWLRTWMTRRYEYTNLDGEENRASGQN